MLTERGPMAVTQPTTIKEGGVPPGVSAKHLDAIHIPDIATMLDDVGPHMDHPNGHYDYEAETVAAISGGHMVNGEVPGQQEARRPTVTAWEQSTLAARTSDMNPQLAIQAEHPGSYPGVDRNHPMAGKLPTSGRVFGR